MTLYYFVETALPERHSDMSFAELDELFKGNLKKKDYEKTLKLRFLIDLENLRLFWQERALDPRGVLDKVGIEAAFLEGGVFPEWLEGYLEEYKETEERLRYFPQVWALFFREEVLSEKGFLREYFEFEQGVRLILSALRAKKMDRDLAKELQFEDPSNPLVQEILLQKDTQNFVPPSDYEELARLFLNFSEDPLLLDKALENYRFRKIEEMKSLQNFTVDRLLAYMAQHLRKHYD